MVRNIIVLSGSSHPNLTDSICNNLGIPPAKAYLGKFSVGETRVEIQESVRGKDVFIVQSGGGRVNDHLMELLIIISACKIASANRITAVLPLFPYSRQPGVPYVNRRHNITPLSSLSFGHAHSISHSSDISRPYSIKQTSNTQNFPAIQPVHAKFECMNLTPEIKSDSILSLTNGTGSNSSQSSYVASTTCSPDSSPSVAISSILPLESFEPQRGYKQWVAQAGTLVAGLLTCAGANHIITMDLHDPQYQGFFDIPVDNLYGHHLLLRYIQFEIPNYKEGVIVSPDAGGAKRATAVADNLGIRFALIHKDSRTSCTAGSSMTLVGNVQGRTAILIDDLVDTGCTITRAAQLLKSQGATRIYALITHGVLSGDAIERINASVIDKIIVTNSVDQSENIRQCPKLEVLEVGKIFAEAIRRVHHGESISVLFHYDYE